ncbi:hypothetical protein [Mycoplasma seminis]|uniref:Uncharacterized protein n=1 Tax=Mycoplasma seminis TaxID=512749 RepID=A0ABY9HC60_9MOLU|nr:hypothetical protein [Mycoplasma seminis]WLP85846.1 hypothetical protein Q8852_01720 [Mycoplasma seminis]
MRVFKGTRNSYNRFQNKENNKFFTLLHNKFYLNTSEEIFARNKTEITGMKKKIINLIIGIWPIFNFGSSMLTLISTILVLINTEWNIMILLVYLTYLALILFSSNITLNRFLIFFLIKRNNLQPKDFSNKYIQFVIKIWGKFPFAMLISFLKMYKNTLSNYDEDLDINLYN